MNPPSITCATHAALIFTYIYSVFCDSNIPLSHFPSPKKYCHKNLELLYVTELYLEKEIWKTNKRLIKIRETFAKLQP